MPLIISKEKITFTACKKKEVSLHFELYIHNPCLVVIIIKLQKCMYIITIFVSMILSKQFL